MFSTRRPTPPVAGPLHTLSRMGTQEQQTAATRVEIARAADCKTVPADPLRFDWRPANSRAGGRRKLLALINIDTQGSQLQEPSPS